MSFLFSPKSTTIPRDAPPQQPPKTPPIQQTEQVSPFPSTNTDTTNQTQPPASSSLSRSTFRARIDSLFSRRSLKQSGLFFAGAVFLVLSTRLTRRTFLRKRQQIYPPFWRQSHEPPENPISGGLDALEALQLATLNVCSGAMMLVGGTLWAMNVSTLDELRQKVRGGLGVDGTGRSEKEVEDDWEEWLAETLERRRKKQRGEGSGELGDEASADDGQLPDTRIKNARGRPR